MFFARSDWLLNQWISCTIHWFTSSSSERATTNSRKLRAKCLPGLLIKQAVSEIHEEGDEVRIGSLTGKALSFWHEFIDKTGCFLVLRTLLFVSFCVVVWVLFSVFSIFCITSLVSATPRNHHKTGEKVFCLQMQIKFTSCVTLFSWVVHK